MRLSTMHGAADRECGIQNRAVLVAVRRLLRRRQSSHASHLTALSCSFANAVGAALMGRPRAGATLFALANATLAAGHVVEGNLLRDTRDTLRHPLWAVRADVAVANATIMDALRSR